MSAEYILGLDIGPYQIKAVKIAAGRKVRITALETIDIRQYGSLEAALEQLRERDLACESCVTSIHPGRLSLRNMSMPFRDERKIRQTIAFELEPVIPFPIEDAVIDFTLSADAQPPEMQAGVLAAVAPKAVVRERIQLLENYVPEVSVIDVDAFPLAARLVNQARDGLRDCVLLIDIGAEKSAGFLLDGGRVCNIRSYDFGGDTLTAIIADAAGLQPDEAERKKISADFGAAKDRTDKACRDFAAEVKATLDMIRLSGQPADPARVMFTGGGSLFPALKENFAAVFGVPVETADLTEREDFEIESGVTAAWGLQFNNALALALRGMKKASGMDFRRGPFELEKHALKLRRDLRWAAMMVLISLAALLVDQGLGYYLDYVKLRNLQSAINAVFRESCPEVTKIVDPVQQLKTKITEARKISVGNAGTPFLDLLKDISATVPQSTGFIINNLSYDGERIEMKAETTSFNTAEEVKKSLAASRYFSNVSLGSANLTKQGGKVEFGIRMDVKK
ncbi:MAG: pilus assembly protein PilM [Syntrophaceae bacterium]